MNKEIIKGTHGKDITIYTVEPKDEAIAFVNIFHGASEHALRYQETAKALADQGFYVVMHDHLGHGNTAEYDDLVIFAENHGAQKQIDTTYDIFKYTHDLNPQLPIFAIAHSMGTLILRALINQKHDIYDGVVYIGSPFISKVKVKMVKRLAKAVKLIKGPYHISKLITDLTQDNAYNSMKKRGLIEHRHEWVTSNKEVQNQAQKDPKIGLPFTISAQLDLFDIILVAHQWCPFPGSNDLYYIICGDQDALCDYGKSVQKLSQFLEQQGFTNVKHKVYPNSRHELLNEPIRKKVLHDIVEHFKVCIENS